MLSPTNHNPPVVMQPSKQALNFPSAHVVPEFATILCRLLFPITFVGRYQLNSTFLVKALIKFVTVMGFIAYDFIRRISGKTAVYRSRYQHYFVN